MAFAYSPMNEDELELVVGETIEIIKEVEFFFKYTAAQMLK